MNIPNFENVEFVNNNRYLSDQWSLILQNLITQMQNNLSNNGYPIPQLAGTDITNLQTKFNSSSNSSQYFGWLVYNTTTNKLMMYNLGSPSNAFVNITTS